MILKVTAKPNATANDFKKLNELEHVRVRVGIRKRGFSCSVSIYLPEECKHGPAKGFKIMDLSYIGNLYARVTHHIKQELEAAEMRETMGPDEMFIIEEDVVPVADHVEAYRQAMLSDFGKNTTGLPTKSALMRASKTNKWSNLGDYVRCLSDKNAELGVMSWLEDWHESPKPDGWPKKDGTKNRGTSNTRAFMRWLFKKAKLIPRPIKLDDIEWYSEDTSEISPFYMIDEIRRMLAVDDPQVFKVAVAAYTGMRLQEMLNLRWSDLRKNTLTVRKIFSKTGRVRLVRVMPELMKVLNRRRDDGHSYDGFDIHGNFVGNDFMISNKHRMKGTDSQFLDLIRIMKKAGVSPMAPEVLANYEADLAHADDPDKIPKPRERRWHAFRWTYASCMMRSDYDSSRLILQLGHSEPAMMRHYAQISELMDEVEDEDWPAGKFMFTDKAASRSVLRLISN